MYLENLILKSICLQNHIALVVASLEIVLLLLEKGRTEYLKLKVLLELDATSQLSESVSGYDTLHKTHIVG